MHLDIPRLVEDHMGGLEVKVDLETRAEIKKLAIQILEANEYDLTSGHAVIAIEDAAAEVIAARKQAASQILK